MFHPAHMPKRWQRGTSRVTTECDRRRRNHDDRSIRRGYCLGEAPVHYTRGRHPQGHELDVPSDKLDRPHDDHAHSRRRQPKTASRRPMRRFIAFARRRIRRKSPLLATPSTAKIAVSSRTLSVRRSGPRPPAFQPPVELTLAWDQTRFSIPGPVTMPPWLRESPAFKEWQQRGSVETFNTSDDEGCTYEVFVNGEVKDKSGQRTTS